MTGAEGTRGWTSKVKGFYLVEDGGKKTINLIRVLQAATLTVVALFLLLIFTGNLFQSEDTSVLTKTTTKANEKNQTKGEQIAQNNMGGIQNQQTDSKTEGSRRVPHVKINYRAKQVLTNGGNNQGKSLPTGVNLIGKLITSIDTRASDQKIKVILPYGGKHKGSGASLPINTILLGRVSYSGKGEKVLINFNSGVLPTGDEIQLQAQALDAKDYSVGLKGEVHGNAIGRTAATLGLTMVSGMTETLVQKEALGQGFDITPKASLQNGFFNGLSQVTRMEATRKAQEMQNAQSYLTVDAGKDLIISLTGSYEVKNSQ